MKKDKPIYVLGTGLSHDGSACLLKDGKIVYAIEKERVTRVKHDGFNDREAIKYCLEAEGITIDDLNLVVQNANFGSFEFGNDYFFGDRLFGDDYKVPVVTISHHLAHAYNAIGTAPFNDMAVLVLDGCGSPADECIDVTSTTIQPENMDRDIKHLYAEKDSFYSYSGNKYQSVYKDFSPMGLGGKQYPMHPPTTKHSIGGIYSAVSGYCFGNLGDEGKLMGLAPFGDPGKYNYQIFDLKDGRIFVHYDWMKNFRKPARNYNEFKNNFKYYADIAAWCQKEVERAVLYVINSRAQLLKTKNLAYTGGVALNAVANARILKETPYENVYMTPAAGDNGLSIGCAYYGWLEVLKKERVLHNGSSCFGKTYSNAEIKEELDMFILPYDNFKTKAVENFFEILPDCLDKETAAKENLQHTFQFNIKDAGIFSLNINKDQFTSAKQYLGKPDATANTNSQIVLNSSRDMAYFYNSVSRTQTKVEGSLAIFDKLFLEEKAEKHFKLFNESIKKKKLRLNYTEVENITKETAKLLAEGKVIGWFNGGSEFGPRALGHRSILADPRKKDIQNFINAKVKFREDFRPFAPSVLLEDVNEYFQYEGESPYMILVAPVKQEWKEKIPGVVHKNNTSRIQTVTSIWNKAYHQLLVDFKKITGISVLLNTSFNRKGMPIVETPQDALAFFFECELDVLVMGNYIISKSGNEKKDPVKRKVQTKSN
jgi:predicted NodU family carbamoyl transferase